MKTLMLSEEEVVILYEWLSRMTEDNDRLFRTTTVDDAERIVVDVLQLKLRGILPDLTWEELVENIAASKYRYTASSDPDDPPFIMNKVSRSRCLKPFRLGPWQIQIQIRKKIDR